MKRCLPLLLLVTACADVTAADDHDHEGEVITTVVLELTDPDGGYQAATWADPTQSGQPSVDTVSVVVDTVYAVSVRFVDELSEPAVDLTQEIRDEGEQHQVFFTGPDVRPLAASDAAAINYTYEDQDAGGLPLGLSASLQARVEGSFDLTVTLRHLPPESGAAVKEAGLAERVHADGLDAIGGDTDVQVVFPVVVLAPQ